MAFVILNGPEHYKGTDQNRGSEPFSDHVPLQRFNRWACTPSAFEQMRMYP